MGNVNEGNRGETLLCGDLLKTEIQRDQLLSMAQPLELISEGASITCPKSNRFVYVNPIWLRIYGYLREEVYGRPAKLLNVQGSASLIKTIVKETLKGGWQGKVINRDQADQKFEVHLRTSCLRAEDGALIGLLGISSPTKKTKETTGEAMQMAVETLTVRERDVFRLIGEGFSTAQIARRLGISIFTVQTYRNHIKRKLCFRTATALAHGAFQWRTRR